MEVLIYHNSIGHFEILPTLIYYLNQLEICPIIFDSCQSFDQSRIKYLENSYLNFKLTKSKPELTQFQMIIISTYYPFKFLLIDINDLVKLDPIPIILITHEYHAKFDDLKILSQYQHFHLLWLAPHSYQLALKDQRFSSSYLLPVYFERSLDLSNGLDSSNSSSVENHFGDLFNSKGQRRKPLRILIQGNIKLNRRNYRTLFKLAEKFPKANFYFVIIGRGDQETRKFFKESPHYQTKFKIFLNLNDTQYHQKMKSCHLIMPLIDESYDHLYFTSKLTSSISVGIGYNIPMILHQRLASIYSIKGQLIYAGSSNLFDVFRKALKMSEDRYLVMKNSLDLVYQREIDQGQENFWTLIQSNLQNYLSLCNDDISVENNKGNKISVKVLSENFKVEFPKKNSLSENSSEKFYSPIQRKQNLKFDLLSEIKLLHMPLIFGTHHRCGTLLMTLITKEIAEFLSYSFVRGIDVLNQSKLNHPILWMNPHSKFSNPASLNSLSFRGIHVYRHPCQIIISGYFYHLKCKEKWCIDPNQGTQANGCKYSFRNDQGNQISYQEKLRELSVDQGILFEMRGRSYETIMDMYSWNYSDDRFLNLKYEDLISNFENIISRIFKFLKIDQLISDKNQRQEIISKLKKHHPKFQSQKQINKNPHITNKELDLSYSRYFKKQHYQAFDELFPNDLMTKLGY